MLQKLRANIVSILVAHHTEISLRFSRFENYTQPRKNEGRRMSALTKIRISITVRIIDNVGQSARSSPFVKLTEFTTRNQDGA